MLGITSGGSFALNSCLEKTNTITSLDLNHIQNYILELKISAIDNLSYEEFWTFMTNKDTLNIELYKTIRRGLSKNTKEYFDKNIRIIKNGVLNNGVLHFGLNLMRHYLIFFAGKDKIKSLVNSKNLSEQMELYKYQIEPKIWNFHSNNLSLWSMFLYGVSPKQIRLIRREKIKTIRDIYKKRMEEIFSNDLIRNNFYWYFILTGEYDRKIAPPYLRQENYLTLKKNVKKIKIVYSDILSFIRSSNKKFKKINLSDVPDWLDDKDRQYLFNEISKISDKNTTLILRTKSKKLLNKEFKEFILKKMPNDLSKIEKSASYNLVQVFYRK